MARLEIPIKVDIYKIEELIDKLKNLQTYKLFAGDEMTLVDRDEVVEIITDHVKAEVSPPDQRWIPCSKQMPEEFGYYLCWYEYCHVSKNKVLPEYGIGYYDPEMEFWSGEVRQGRGAKVLAWTFLPEPWEGEQNG